MKHYLFFKCVFALRVQSVENHKTGPRSANYSRRGKHALLLEINKKRREDEEMYEPFDRSTVMCRFSQKRNAWCMSTFQASKDTLPQCPASVEGSFWTLLCW